MSFKGNYIYVVVLSLVFFISCQENKSAEKKEAQQEVQKNTPEVKSSTSKSASAFKAIVYRNTLNDITDINLTIKKEGTFICYLAPLKEPKPGEVNKSTTVQGTWTQRDQWLVLSIGDKSIKASTLFESKQNEDFKIVNDHTVEINSAKKEVSILGIKCIKSIIK